MSIKQTVQCWAGYFTNRQAYQNLIEENPLLWALGEVDDSQPLNAFVASQGETWLDDDGFYAGFNDNTAPLAQRFSAFLGTDNIAQHTAALIESAAEQKGLAQINALILVAIDPKGNHRQIDLPQSVTSDDFSLCYLGEFDISGNC